MNIFISNGSSPQAFHHLIFCLLSSIILISSKISKVGNFMMSQLPFSINPFYKSMRLFFGRAAENIETCSSTYVQHLCIIAPKYTKMCAYNI